MQTRNKTPLRDTVPFKTLSSPVRTPAKTTTSNTPTRASPRKAATSHQIGTASPRHRRSCVAPAAAPAATTPPRRQNKRVRSPTTAPASVGQSPASKRLTTALHVADRQKVVAFRLRGRVNQLHRPADAPARLLSGAQPSGIVL
jgi:hypothetical protein